MTEVTLQILEGLERGKVFSFLEPPFTIGREISNVIALNDESVSRYHAKIQEDNGKIILTDLGSTNGTRINGHPIQLKVLKPGDQVHIGRCILLFGNFEEIDESLGYPGSASDSGNIGLTTREPFRVEEGDVNDSGSCFDVHEAGLELFPQGCPQLPDDLKLVQRAQISDLIAFMHNRIVQLMAESYEEFDDDEDREVRIRWKAWQRLIRTEMELAQALQKIADPDS
jgi:predicted component of type VI protein secretion system